MPARSSPTGRIERIAVALLIGGLGALSVALALASLVPYEPVKERLDSFASDGDAAFTRADFDAVVIRIRAAAVAAALASVAAYALRDALAGRLAHLVRDTTAAAATLRRAIGGGLGGASRTHLGALAAVTAVGVVVRLEFLFQPMRYDEAATFVHYASRAWYIPLTTYTAPNNHIFHSVLVHVSTGLFGGDPWAVRLPAFLAGVLLVPAVYVTARHLYDRHVALLAAGLTAVSSVLVEYSTNARGYTILALVFVLLLGLAVRLTESENRAEWLAFAVLSAVGFYTIPVMLYAFAGLVAWLALWLLRTGRGDLLRHRLLPTVGATILLTALLYAPVAAASGVGSLVDNEFVRTLGLGTFAAALPDSLASVLRGWHRDIPLPLAVALAAAFVLALVVHRRLSRVAVPPALGVLAGILPLLLVQRVVPFERVWLFLLPLYLMGAAAGLLLFVRPLVRRSGREGALAGSIAVAACVALGANVVSTQAVARSEDTSTFRDAAEVSRLLEERLQSSDKVLVAPPADGILEYYLSRRGLDPAALLYWREPGAASRFLAVVKEAPGNYPLEHLLSDPRLRGVRLDDALLLRRYDEAAVYEVRRTV